MIMISGLLADEMTELMCARLTERGYPYFLLDQRHFPGSYDLTWECSGERISGFVQTPTERIELEDLTGIYARYVEFRDERAPRGLTERERALADAEYQLSLMQLLDVIPCVVVNRPQASLSNDSKLYQQQMVREFGFATPKTLVTTVPDAAEEFYQACGKNVIYKSLSGVRSIVHHLSDEDLPRLKLLANSPTQFQEYVEGTDIRVHTVAEEVFATEIRSTASDYRYARAHGKDLSLRPTRISEDAAEACVRLSRAHGLVVAGIDLRASPEGRYYCFEVNPSPAFVFYERGAGQPISKAVADVLKNGHAFPLHREGPVMIKQIGDIAQYHSRARDRARNIAGGSHSEISEKPV